MSFEVEGRAPDGAAAALPSDVGIADDPDDEFTAAGDGSVADGHVIIRTRAPQQPTFTATANPLAASASAEPEPEPEPLPQQQPEFCPIGETELGDCDWVFIFEGNQDINRQLLVGCLKAGGLNVIQSIAGGADENAAAEARRVFVRIRAAESAMRAEAERTGLPRELDPGSQVRDGRELAREELIETGKPRMYGKALDAGGRPTPVSIQDDTQQRYGFYRYSAAKEHFFVQPRPGERYFHSGDRQRLVRSLMETALHDYHAVQKTDDALYQLLSAALGRGAPRRARLPPARPAGGR